jgi:hypothetical protein
MFVTARQCVLLQQEIPTLQGTQTVHKLVVAQLADKFPALSNLTFHHSASGIRQWTRSEVHRAVLRVFSARAAGFQ